MELFDTTYIIDLINSDEGAVEKARKMDSYGTIPALSVISVHEYLLGVHMRYRDEKRLLANKLARANQDLGSFEILPLTHEITELSATIHSNLSAEGKVIGINDIYIAATAMYHSIKLITRDTLHFKRVKGLNVESY